MPGRPVDKTIVPLESVTSFGSTPHIHDTFDPVVVHELSKVLPHSTIRHCRDLVYSINAVVLRHCGRLIKVTHFAA